MAGRGHGRGGLLGGGLISGSAMLWRSGNIAPHLGSGGGHLTSLGEPPGNEGKGTQIGVEKHHGDGGRPEITTMTSEHGGIGPSASSGKLHVVGGMAGQPSHGSGGPPRSPDHGGIPEFGHKLGSGEPGMVCYGKACGGCYYALTRCLNFFCCGWRSQSRFRAPMDLPVRPPGSTGTPRP